MSSEARETRRGWQLQAVCAVGGAIISALVFAGRTLGFKTPAQSQADLAGQVQELRQHVTTVIDPKVAQHDVVIAQMKQEIDDIHDAVVGGKR